MDIDCAAPVCVTLPVMALKPLLRERKHPAVTLAIDTAAMTATLATTTGRQTTVACRAGADYVAYRQVLPTTAVQPCVSTAIDATLLAKFGMLAKALGVAPYVQLEFRKPLAPIAVTGALRHAALVGGI